MRGMIIEESLVDPSALERLSGSVIKRDSHSLDGQPIEIAEIDVSDENALTVARILAESLLPTRVYAHLLGERLMIVIFPGVLALVHRGDPQSGRRAQQIGALFEIPLAQMQFVEMFEVDHPDQGAR